MAGPFDLKPLTVVEILDRAFSIYRSRFFTFFAILAVAYVPVNVALVAFHAARPDAFTAENPREARMLGLLQQLFDTAVYGLAFTIAVGATTRAVGDLYAGERGSFRRSYGALLRTLPQYLATTMLSSFICTMGFFLCVIPGLVFSVWFAFSTSVCVLERLWGPIAMARSRALARDHGGRIFVLFLLAGILTAVVDTAVSEAADGLLPSFLPDEWTRWYVSNALTSVATLLVTPYFSIAWVLLYYDLRIRKEAFDLELLARSLAGRSPDTPPSGA